MKKRNQSENNRAALYLAKMVHDEKSIRRLATVQYDTFQVGRKLLLTFAGVLMILLGVVAGLSLPVSGVILFLGCFCLWLCKAMPQITANRMIAAINDAYPCTQLYFQENELEITDGKEWFKMPYKVIRRIIQDDEYYYLFLTRATSYMVDKASFIPADLNQFCMFLEGRTALFIERPVALFQLNIPSIIRRIKNRKLARGWKERK